MRGVSQETDFPTALAARLPPIAIGVPSRDGQEALVGGGAAISEGEAYVAGTVASMGQVRGHVVRCPP